MRRWLRRRGKSNSWKICRVATQSSTIILVVLFSVFPILPGHHRTTPPLTSQGPKPHRRRFLGAGIEAASARQYQVTPALLSSDIQDLRSSSWDGLFLGLPRSNWIFFLFFFLGGIGWYSAIVFTEMVLMWVCICLSGRWAWSAVRNLLFDCCNCSWKLSNWWSPVVWFVPANNRYLVLIGCNFLLLFHACKILHTNQFLDPVSGCVLLVCYVKSWLFTRWNIVWCPEWGNDRLVDDFIPNEEILFEESS